MDLVKAIRTFVNVVAHQSFSAAAREQGLVTSAVSRQVAELESHYGCQLLTRSTRTMSLTAEGEYFLAEFKAILARLDQLELGAGDRRNKVSGLIRITSPLHSAQLSLQPSLSRFMAKYPEVSLSWLLANRSVNLLEEGVDLAIRVGELPDSSLVARRFTTVSVVFVASPDYLARHGTPDHPRALVHHRCLVDNSNPQLARWRYQEGGREHQIRVPATVEVNKGDLAGQFAADGHGIAQLPQFMVQQYLAEGRLVPILQAYALTPQPVSLVYPANRTNSVAVQALIEHLMADRPANLVNPSTIPSITP
ncbi:LysR family transcriptional regulator [Ferrimonas balearica]|uniref:LysR family transcriptional regulator n=1 Tax=Ferrimonas balearica TaxID=44012 RepID=UPI001C57C93E|nr:LysR family transcriptional regulator [Ferrimonas balearica]MBW3139130.1 LysR family transcriptional regulator [Ferrimonas balearica]MBY6106192.1 LysR family transcriptional regulator [Ferrimonas balearica]